MAPLAAFLEKSAKYSKKWTKRYVTFDPDTKKLNYGESSEKAAKASMVLTNIVRTSEKDPKVVAGNPDLFSFSVQGTHTDGKTDTWGIRCPDANAFDEWYFAIRNCLAAHGVMDPFHYGLPSRDPRTDLDFAHVPVEHLYRFSLLDRAIMYLFETVQVQSATSVEKMEEFLVIGDRCLYLFKVTADVHRCVPIVQVKKVFAGNSCVGFQIQEPQHDILILDTLHAAKIVTVMERVLKAIPNTQKVEIDTSIANPEAIAEQLHIGQREKYELVVTAPTPKMKLKVAMDLYEKQTGQAFVYGSASKPAAPVAKSKVHDAPEAMDMEDPMAALLLKVGLKEYVVMLQRQHVDVDLLSCMDPNDLVNFGVTNPAHRERIIAAAKGEPFSPAAPSSPASQPMQSPSAARPAIVLDSDSDGDDFQITVPKARQISLDDDDDDDVVVLPKSNARAINLDSDSDDGGLPPPKPAAKPAVNLDDDDDDDI